MKILFLTEDEQGDHTGPIIEIRPENERETFDLGIIFQRVISANGCVWRINTGIRLPLILADEIGLAITYKKKSG